MYIDVWELSRDQLNELKENYFYHVLESDSPYNSPEEIPDQIIFNHYKHVAFVNDDFFCTAGR